MSSSNNTYSELRKVLLSVKKAFDDGRISSPGNYPDEDSAKFVEKLRDKIDSALSKPPRRCDDYDDWREAYGDFVRSDEFIDAGDEDIFEWILGIPGMEKENGNE